MSVLKRIAEHPSPGDRVVLMGGHVTYTVERFNSSTGFVRVKRVETYHGDLGGGTLGNVGEIWHPSWIDLCQSASSGAPG